MEPQPQSEGNEVLIPQPWRWSHICSQKGMRFLFLNLVAYCLEALSFSWQHEQRLRVEMICRVGPNPGEELSFLHKQPRAWDFFAKRMGFGIVKSTAVLAVSMGVRPDLENQAEGFNAFIFPRILAARLTLPGGLNIIHRQQHRFLAKLWHKMMFFGVWGS